MSTPPPSPPRRTSTANRIGLALGGAAVLLLIITFAIASGSGDQSEPEAQKPPPTSSLAEPPPSSTSTSTTTTPPPTTTSTSSTTSTTTTSTTTTSTTTTTTTTVPSRPTVIGSGRNLIIDPSTILWEPGDGSAGLAADLSPDGMFELNLDWWLVSTTRPGFDGCSGSHGGYVARPAPLSVLGLATGWYGCGQGGNLVVELKVHEVLEDRIDLEWWIWRRP